MARPTWTGIGPLTALLGGLGAWHASAFGQATIPPDEKDAKATDSKPESPAGILPLVDYSGDFWNRSRVTGDWDGGRTRLASKGVMLDVDWTQTAMGVVSGGKDVGWNFGGSLDLAGSIDLHRMDVIKGALIEFRVEGRYGDSINSRTGSIVPVDTDLFVPITTPDDQHILTVTELCWTQFLGEHVAVTAGKFQTLDGDPNEFASGRGRSQFMNMSFVQNTAALLTVPYSTLGGGLIVLPTDKIIISSLLMATTDSSTTTGFNHIDDGWSWVTEADFQYKLGTLPGGFNAGAVWAFDGDFSHLGGRLSLVPDEGITLATNSDSWAFYASAWQYVYTPETTIPDKLDMANGRPDIRGVGLFARLGFADEDTNPISWTISGGLGSRGLIPGRDSDLCGIAYIYSQLEHTRGFELLGLQDHTQAVEAFYNFAITPAIGLTADAQWTDAAPSGIDEAVIVGARLDVRF